MQAKLVAATREDKGKRAAKRMRREGRIPAVLYGHDFEPVTLALDERSFKALLRQGKGLHGLLDLKIEGGKGGEHAVVIKEVQRHPFKDHILHVDFQKIRSGEMLHAEVSLNFIGEPVGVKAGGILQHYLYEVSVQCLPADLPEYFDVDITHLDLKDNLRVSDLPRIEGVKYLNSPEEIVTAVTPKRVREEVRVLEEVFEEAPAEVAAPEETTEAAEGEGTEAPPQG